MFKLIYVIVNNNTVEPMIKDYSEIMKKLKKKKRSLKRERVVCEGQDHLH